MQSWNAAGVLHGTHWTFVHRLPQYNQHTYTVVDRPNRMWPTYAKQQSAVLQRLSDGHDQHRQGVTGRVRPVGNARCPGSNIE